MKRREVPTWVVALRIVVGMVAWLTFSAWLIGTYGGGA